MKQGAIFDMDGLLLDTERMYRDSWKQSAQQFGLVHNPDFPRAVCGSNGAHMREIISQYYPQVDAKAFADDCILRVERELETHVPEKAGVREILQYFKQCGVKIAVRMNIHGNGAIFRGIDHSESENARKHRDFAFGGFSAEKHRYVLHHKKYLRVF